MLLVLSNLFLEQHNCDKNTKITLPNDKKSARGGNPNLLGKLLENI
jgi:hypothetical protein